MKLIPTKISDCFKIEPEIFKDQRGSLVNTFNNRIFSKNGLETSFPSDFYSVSNKGVLRGLHFQIPPFEHTKLVYCVDGKIMDVIFDMRKASRTYAKFETFILDSDKADMIYIAPGIAHGFCVLSKMAIVGYKVSSLYSKEHDLGIMWNSVGINWPNKNPIISKRDSLFPTFQNFNNPF